jgi:hypothetical protein
MPTGGLSHPPLKLRGFRLAKQPIEVVAHHRLVLAALLEEETGQGRLHQAVLIPLGVLLDEPDHRVKEIRRKLVFHTHVFRHVVGNRLHRTSLALTQPSAHGEPPAVKARSFRSAHSIAM